MEKFKCKDCGQEKTKTEMCTESRLKNGINRQCKKCRSAKRYKNGEYTRERIRKYGYRSADANNIVMITPAEMDEIAKQKHCTYCGDEMSPVNGLPNSMTADHVYPIGDSMNGYGAANLAFNIVPCCRSCNSRKGERHVYEFYQTYDKFTPERWQTFLRGFTEKLFKKPQSDRSLELTTQGMALEVKDLVKWRKKQADKAVSD